MNGAHWIQEITYFRGGATLALSLDGLQNNWLSKRGRGGDRARQCIKKRRDEELRFWIPSGGTTPANEELHLIPCLCVLGQRGTTAAQSRGNNRPKPPPPPFSPQHCRLLELSQPFRHSTITSTASSSSTLVLEWTRHRRDLFSWFPEDLMHQRKVIIILCGADCSMPPELQEDCGKTNGTISCPINDPSGDLKPRPPRWPHSHRMDSSNRKSLLKSSRSCDFPGGSSQRDGGGIKRKCVSFVDDVTVYLFDQESPTMELQRHSPDECTSPPCSFPYTLPDLTVDDSGFEWEDDFSALDWAKRNCHQCVTYSGPRELSVSRTPARTGLLRPRHFFLSQTCLFLTHVTESDLEL